MEPITYAVLTTILIGAVGWLLSNKDEKQSHEIDMLFKKHDEDAAALAMLRVEIAKEHYLKHELDSRVQSLQDTFKEELRDLGHKFDHLANVLLDHVAKRQPGE